MHTFSQSIVPISTPKSKVLDYISYWYIVQLASTYQNVSGALKPSVHSLIKRSFTGQTDIHQKPEMGYWLNYINPLDAKSEKGLDSVG